MAAAPARVSVVVPTFNSTPYLAATLESILGQTMPSLELVVSDDGSQDETLELARSFADRDDRVRVERWGHLGIAANRNAGFAATDARAPYVTFLDHDDVWEASALERLLAVLDAHPGSPAVHGLARCIDEDGVQFPQDDHAERTRHRRAVSGDTIVPIPQAAPTSFNAILVENYVTTPGTSVIRRHAVESIGGFHAPSVPCDDWDLNIRLARMGPLAFLDDIVLSWRRHALATSQTVGSAWRRGYVVTRRRSVRDPANTPEQAAAARTVARMEIADLRRTAVRLARRGAVKQSATTLARGALLSAAYIGGRGRAGAPES